MNSRKKKQKRKSKRKKAKAQRLAAKKQRLLYADAPLGGGTVPEHAEKPGIVIKGEATSVAYDENLLKRTSTQWQFGDWYNLAKLGRENIEHHPARAKLALLAAAGMLQTDQTSEARKFVRLALDWGVGKKLVFQILVSGVYNSLGKAMALAGQQETALKHFAQSVYIGSPGTDVSLMAEARCMHQMKQLAEHGINGQAKAVIRKPRTVETFADHNALFKITIQQNNASESIFEVNVYSSHPEWACLEEGQLHYDIPDGSNLYLITSEKGDFNKPPTTNRLELELDMLYQISGNLPSEGTDRPIFWFFEYDESKKINAKSIPCNAGAFKISFHTHQEASTYGLGIRLAGQGILDTESIKIELTTGLEAKLTEQEEQLEQHQADFERYKKQKANYTLKQVEDFVRIQHYLGPEINLPPMHGWPISPDFGLLLIEQVEHNDYDALIEFGSGTSTLMIARALQKQAARAAGNSVPFLSFEHLKQYYDTTRNNLEQAGLTAQVDLQLTPLVPYTAESGDDYLYYDLTDAFSALVSSLPKKPKLLVVVDGPPAATGHHARYPALPLLLEHLPSAQVDLLLDDYIRDDEQQVVIWWQQLLERRGITVEITEFKGLEKQACLFRVQTNN
jgi:predicted O-methyltransferase YrrM